MIETIAVDVIGSATRVSPIENRVLPRNAGSSMGQIRDVWLCHENIAAGVMEG